MRACWRSAFSCFFRAFSSMYASACGCGMPPPVSFLYRPGSLNRAYPGICPASQHTWPQTRREGGAYHKKDKPKVVRERRRDEDEPNDVNDVMDVLVDAAAAEIAAAVRELPVSLIRGLGLLVEKVVREEEDKVTQQKADNVPQRHRVVEEGETKQNVDGLGSTRKGRAFQFPSTYVRDQEAIAERRKRLLVLAKLLLRRLARLENPSLSSSAPHSLRRAYHDHKQRCRGCATRSA